MRQLLILVLVASVPLINGKYVSTIGSGRAVCVEDPDKPTDCRAKISRVSQNPTGGLIVLVDDHDDTAGGACEGALVELVYTVGSNTEEKADIVEGFAVIPLDNICKSVTIQLNTETESEGTLCHQHVHETKPLPVEKVRFEEVDTGDQVKVVWDHDAESCATDLTFEVKVEGAATPEACPNTASKQSECLIDVSDMEACASKTVTVTASFVEGGTADPVTAEYTKRLTPVTLNTLTAGDGVFASFEPLAATGSCNIKEYRLKQEDGSCYESTVSVQVVTTSGTSGSREDETISESKPVTIVRRPERVINPTYQPNGKNINLTWISPYAGDAGEDCNLWYTVLFGAEKITTGFTTAEGINTASACETMDISIAANIGTTAGKDTTIKVEGYFDGVKDLSCLNDETKVTCSWKKPDNVDGCTNVKYEVEYSDGNQVHPPQVIGDEEFPFPASCDGHVGDIYIRVTPVIVDTNNDIKRWGVPHDKIACQSSAWRLF